MIIGYVLEEILIYVVRGKSKRTGIKNDFCRENFQDIRKNMLFVLLLPRHFAKELRSIHKEGLYPSFRQALPLLKDCSAEKGYGNIH